MATEKDILLLLSAYRDGELGPVERARVEKELAERPELSARLADMDAMSWALRATVEARADEAQLAGFSERVMARLDRQRPPLMERVRVSVSELFAFRRLQLAMGAAAAAMLVVLGTVAAFNAGSGGSGDDSAMAQMFSVDDISTPDDVEAILFEADDGTQVLYLQ